MNYFGIYGQHIYKIIPEKLVVNGGIRLQFISLHSTIVDTATQLHLPYTNIQQQNVAVTGNLGLVYFPASKTKMSLVVASGFRNPNIDDLSKIFESNPSNKQLVVPNPDIKPEYTYNVDLALEQSFGDEFKFTLNGYYTWFRNAIVVAPYQLNGQDSILYNGVMSAVLASQNRNKAYLFGVGATVFGKIVRNLEYTGSVNLTEGRFKTDASELSSVYQQQPDGSYKKVQANVSSKPLDHIPPLYGRFSILYSKTKWNVEAYTIFNGWKKIKDYNADGEDNAQYATADGMPSWYTLNLRSEISITRNLRLQAGVENILDRNYRAFASGFSAAGRNLWLSVRASF
jgi:hemoglobin/transferrin/lactoferrin receptor protein